MKKAPTLRFKGFTNDWEQRKFENLVSRLSKTSNNESLPNVTYDDIKSKENSLNKDITELTHGKKGIHFNKDDILFGKLRPYLGNILLARFNGIAVGDFWVLSPKDNNISSFLFDLIQTSKYKYISNLSSGSKMPRSDWNLVSKASFWVPIQQEQNKIGKIFQLIDNLVSLQQRKLELLKASKKAVLQNIFTDTKRVPTIRFNTFSENWNQKRLKPFLIKYNKKTTVNNQYPVLTSSRQGLFFQKDYYDGNQIASKNNIGYNIVPRNYFTYRHMSDDLIFHFNINTICDYGIVSTLYPVFTTTSEIDSQWLLYYLNHSVDIKKYALLQKQGGSRTYMYFSKLESLKAHIPALAEQKKISSLIFKIDEQIYFQQKKLKYLQKSKRFLLQNMFI